MSRFHVFALNLGLVIHNNSGKRVGTGCFLIRITCTRVNVDLRKDTARVCVRLSGVIGR